MINGIFDFCFPIILIGPRKRMKRLLTFGWEVWTLLSPTTKDKTVRGSTRLARVGNYTSITRNTQVVSEVLNIVLILWDVLDKNKAYDSILELISFQCVERRRFIPNFVEELYPIKKKPDIFSLPRF